MTGGQKVIAAGAVVVGSTYYFTRSIPKTLIATAIVGGSLFYIFKYAYRG